MFKTLTDTSKAAIFTALVLILAVAAALAINAWGLASNEFAWAAVWSITPVLATLIMLLVVTREGYSRKGWQSLGLHRLGLRMWPIAFFGTLAITVAATAAVWATPLASVTAPAGGILNSAVGLVIQVLILATTFSLAEEIGIRGYLLPKLLPLGRKRALLVSGLVWATWHMPLLFLTSLIPVGNKVIAVPAVLRRRRGRKLLLRLPENRLRQPVALLDRARGAQQRLGSDGGLHRHLLPRAGQQLPSRRLRHPDHRRRRPRSRARQPDDAARRRQGPPRCKPACARTGYPNRSSRRFQAGLVMPQARLRSLAGASSLETAATGARAVAPHGGPVHGPDCAELRAIRHLPAVPTSSQSTPTLTGRCASCASPAWLSASCTTTR